jgi:hypothetical protein
MFTLSVELSTRGAEIFTRSVEMSTRSAEMFTRSAELSTRSVALTVAKSNFGSIYGFFAGLCSKALSEHQANVTSRVHRLRSLLSAVCCLLFAVCCRLFASIHDLQFTIHVPYLVTDL